MASTYQTRLFKAVLTDFELGWQIANKEILFASNQYEDVCDAVRELEFHEQQPIIGLQQWLNE